ncbi:unnamed protein product [Phaedon cochleariae]|uniref:Uncharacterized protein n=1 Tax=Phaedon cochleariae TaxID=80249 RepID=A0A9N9SK73_PHACE|nr:unnamed protein product [Phaedon cochleariae]
MRDEPINPKTTSGRVGYDSVTSRPRISSDPTSPDISNDSTSSFEQDTSMLQNINEFLNFSSAVEENKTSTPSLSPSSSKTSIIPTRSNTKPRPNQSSRNHSIQHNENIPPTKTFNPRSLPIIQRSQKKLHNLLNTNELLRNRITFLKANLNQTALLKTTSQITQKDFENKLKNSTGDKKIRVILLSQRIPTDNTPEERDPNFSMVIKGVPNDITLDDLEEAIESLNFPIIKCWRITFRATNQPTTLIRVITDSETHYSNSLNLGISFFGMNY